MQNASMFKYMKRKHMVCFFVMMKTRTVNLIDYDLKSIFA